MPVYGPYGSGAQPAATFSRQRGMGRVEEFAKSPYTTQFEGEPERIGALQALAGERETAGLGAQEEALGRAQMAALGQGPSAAEALARGRMEEAERTALAGAAEARGPGAALAGRTAQVAGAGAQQRAISDLAGLRAQEQLAAMGQEQALSTQMRGQALEGALGFGAQGLGTREAMAQEQLAQTQQRLEAERIGEEQRRGRASVIKDVIGGIGKGVSGLLAGLSDERAKVAPGGQRKFDWQQFGRALAGQEAPVKGETSALGALAGGSAGGMTTISDESAKQAYELGVKDAGGLPDGGPAIRRVMEASGPKAFEYKADPGTPRVGLSANELAKTPEGAAAVERGSDGLLRVDPGQASMMAMAGAADLHERVKALEAAKGGAPQVVGLEREAKPSPADEAALLLASDDPNERARGRMLSLVAAPEPEPVDTRGTVAALAAEQPRRTPTPAETYAEDLRRFRLRQVREGAEASRPRPKPARDPLAEQIATTRGLPYSTVLEALGRTV